MTEASRAWCAICQYDGKAQFILGTVNMDGSAKQHEIEAAVHTLMDRLFPSRPRLLNLIPGCLTFHGDEK